MDNVSFHKCKHVKELVEVNDHMVRMLLPYSSFLNLIGNLFLKWKKIIKHARSLTGDDLFRAIHNRVSEIFVEDCCGFYRHVFKYMSQCLKKLNNYRIKLKVCSSCITVFCNFLA